jgi:hypothetical protein
MDEFMRTTWIAYEREDELAIRAINGCPSLSAQRPASAFMLASNQLAAPTQ